MNDNLNAVDFSSETMEVKRQWDILKMVKERSVNPEFYRQ